MEPGTAANDPSDRDRIRSPWSPEEDDRLSSLVRRQGPMNWNLISKTIPGRSAKSCRLRWCNQLSPDVERRPFTAQEDKIIIQAQAIHGNRWAMIARMLHARSDNAVKNHWNSRLKRRMQADNIQDAVKRQRLHLSPFGVSTELSLKIPGTETNVACKQCQNSNLIDGEDLQQENTAVPKKLVTKLQKLVREEVRNAMIMRFD